MLDSIPRPDAAQTRRILFASLIGTTIEFFDFYIYATAAVLVFPKLFFPKGDPATALLQSFATFALAFFARPIGSAVFGHFGDLSGKSADVSIIERRIDLVEQTERRGAISEDRHDESDRGHCLFAA